MLTTSFEKVLVWKAIIRYSYQFFYFLFYISFYFRRYHFYNFLEFLELSEKKFCPKFSFFNGFTHFAQPQPFNGQNLLNVTKAFCQFSIKCLVKYIFFLQKFIDKILQSIFLNGSTADSLVFFSKHSSIAAILTHVSVITCK